MKPDGSTTEITTKADAVLFVYRYDEKTKTCHLVKKEDQTVKADKEGNIRLDLKKGKSSQRYELVGKKQFSCHRQERKD